MQHVEFVNNEHIFVKYFTVVAFLVAVHQNRYLIGSKGLLPAPNFLRQVKNIANGDIWEMLQRTPTILWFLDWEQVRLCVGYFTEQRYY